MIYELFTHMELATERLTNELLPLLSEQRRQEALRYSHTFGRFCSAKSYCMLQELIAALSPTLDGRPVAFRYNEYGKPYIDCPLSLSFSISHTKNAILVALSEDGEIGADVEQIRHPSEGLIAKTMNEAEQQLIARADLPDAAFTSLWTQKEAVLKLRGTGIQDDLYDVLTQAKADGIKIETHIRQDAGFCYSFATY